MRARPRLSGKIAHSEAMVSTATAWSAGTIAPGLHIVATPIGNLGDINLRALATLAGADVIACEDTRVTRKLLDRYAIATPLTPYHDHNATTARPKLLRRLAEGAAVALVSDAGTPLVSDPGYKLVRAAQEAGTPVTALPGRLVRPGRAHGLRPADGPVFVRRLPAAQTGCAARRVSPNSPVSRQRRAVRDRSAARRDARRPCSGLGEREAAVCRELTKLHEEVRRGMLARAGAAKRRQEMRGEIVLVIAPPATAGAGRASRYRCAVARSALARVSLKDAVGEVAAATGLPRRELYQRALALAEETNRTRPIDGAPR